MSVATKSVGSAAQPGRRPRQGHRPGPLRLRAAGRERRLRRAPWSATIAAGEIDAIDPGRALALPGVLAVISHDNAPRLGETDDGELLLFQSDTVHYRGQIVAAVVAETLEAAREAAAAVRIDYAPRDHDVELTATHPRLYKPDKVNPSFPTDTEQGDAEAGAASAEVQVDQTYATAPIHNNAMEPHATLADLGGRRPHALRLDPGHLRRAPHPRPGVRARPQAGARRRPARRRRLRLQGHAAAAGGARRDRGPHRRAAGQGRAHAPADVRQRRLPHADDPARPPRRDARTAG